MTAHHMNLARPSPDEIIEANRPRDWIDAHCDYAVTGEARYLAERQAHEQSDDDQTLADLQYRRRLYRMQADRAGIDDPAVARLWDDMADRIEDQETAYQRGIAIAASARLAHDMGAEMDLQHDIERDLWQRVKAAGWRFWVKLAAVSAAVVGTVLWGGWLTAWLLVAIHGLLT